MGRKNHRMLPSMKTKAVALLAMHRRVRSSSSVKTLHVVINRTTTGVHQKSSVSFSSKSSTLSRMSREQILLSTASNKRMFTRALPTTKDIGMDPRARVEEKGG